MPTEHLERCPICRKGTFLLEELTPVDGEKESRWRVNCYGCMVQTYHALTRDEAMKIHAEFVRNLNAFKAGSMDRPERRSPKFTR